MKDFIFRILAVGGIVGILDALWLGLVAKKFYKDQLGALLLDKPNVVPAILFYCIYVIGLVVFVLNPALEKQSWLHALGYGALFGLVAYATYDLTNLSTLKGFTVKLVTIDIIWGVCFTAIASVAAYGIIKWLVG